MSSIIADSKDLKKTSKTVYFEISLVNKEVLLYRFLDAIAGNQWVKSRNRIVFPRL